MTAPVRSRRPGQLGLIVLLALTLLGDLHVAGYPFRIDDVEQIPLSGEKLADELGLVTEASDELLSFRAKFPHQFRPLYWASLQAETWLSGERPEPVVFFWVSILVHIGVIAAAWLLFNRLAGQGVAHLGGLFLLLHPAGGEVVTWIAARPDMLVSLFGLLALLAATGGHGPRAALLAGGALVLALTSKVGALVLPPLIAAVWLFPVERRAWTRRLGTVALFAAPVLLTFAWRMGYTGAEGMRYMHTGSVGWETLPSLLGRLYPVLSEVVAPWNDHHDVGQMAAWLPAQFDSPLTRPLTTALLLLVPLGALLAHRGRLLLGGLLALGLALAPAATLPGYSWSTGYVRSLHTAGVAYAFLFALGAMGWVARDRSRGVRAVGLLLIAAQLFVSLDCAHQHRVMQDRSARLIQQQTADAIALADALPPGGQLVVVGLPPFHAGVTELGHMLARAITPPMGDRERPVRVERTLNEYLDSGQVSTWPGTLLIADARSGVIGEDLRRLGPLPTSLPELELVPTDKGPLVYRPLGPCVPRAVGSLALRSHGAGLETLHVTLVTEGLSITNTVDLLPDRETQVLLDEDRRWLAGSGLVEVRLRGPGLRGPDAAPTLRLVGQPPLLQPLAPVDDAVLPMDVVPTFRVPLRDDARAYLVEVRVSSRDVQRFAFVHEWSRATAELHDGQLALDPAAAISPHPLRHWKNLFNQYQLALDADIVDQVRVRWRVRWLSRRQGMVVGSSAWRELRFE